jgi:KRAB domain-containing zinc finger protein
MSDYERKDNFGDEKPLDTEFLPLHYPEISLTEKPEDSSMKRKIRKNHKGKKLFSCSICNSSFTRKKSLKKHIKTVHESMNKYQALTSDQKALLMTEDCSEIKREHSNESYMDENGLENYENEFESSEVQKYSFEDNISDMIIVHNEGGKKQYQCPNCHKSFTEFKNLKSHVLSVHEGIKPHSCYICGNNFSKVANLKSHINSVHEGVKTFSCSYCEKSFTTNQELTRHKVVHAELKPFQCSFCNSSFARNCNLTQHVKIVHEGLRAFLCPICSNTFQYKTDLKRHIQTVHEGKKPFRCSICNSRYTRKMSLKKHIIAAHENKNQVQLLPYQEISLTEENNEENPMISISEIKQELLDESSTG